MEEKNDVSGHDGGEWGLLRMFKRDMEAFPLLSRIEETEVARRARAGDQTAAEFLVESNLRFVVYMTMKYWRPGLPLMDLIAEGCKGLMNAVRIFDPDKGVRLISYAKKAISHEVFRAMNDYYHHKHVSLDEPLGDEEDSTTRKDMIAAKGPGIDETVGNNQVRRSLSELTDQERQIIILRYWRDFTQDDVAVKVGLSRKRVKDLECGALRKMRWSLTGMPRIEQCEGTAVPERETAGDLCHA